MFCSPLRSCSLGSCNDVPNLQSLWLKTPGRPQHRVYKMTFTDVGPCITCLDGQQGSPSFNNTSDMEVLMTHARGIKIAHGPNLKLLVYFSVIAGDVEQRASGLSSQFTPLSPSLWQRDSSNLTRPDKSDE